MTKRNPNARHGPLHPVREVDGVALKVCARCKQEKPITDFWTRGYKSGRRVKSECKPCLIERQDQWVKKNPERAFNLQRKSFIKHTYGISLETFQLMLDMQGYRCPICRQKFEPPTYDRRRSREICVDHDHKTGRVRAILCRNCNSGIGHLQDSADVALAAYLYLKHHESL